MPAGIVFAIASHADLARALPQPTNALDGALHLLALAHDANQVLHHVLQLVLDLIRGFLLGLFVKKGQRPAGRLLHLAGIDLAGGVVFGESRRILAGALAEYK